MISPVMEARPARPEPGFARREAMVAVLFRAGKEGARGGTMGSPAHKESVRGGAGALRWGVRGAGGGAEFRVRGCGDPPPGG